MRGRASIRGGTPTGIGVEDLTAILAERVLGWSVSPDRFLMSDRRWKPRWRFQPTENLQDAFCLLESANPEEYTMHGHGADEFQVRVRLRSGGVGEARDSSKARAIAVAVARAFGIAVEEPR